MSREVCRVARYTCWLSADDCRRLAEPSRSASAENLPHSPAEQGLMSRNKPTVINQPINSLVSNFTQVTDSYGQACTKAKFKTNYLLLN